MVASWTLMPRNNPLEGQVPAGEQEELACPYCQQLIQVVGGELILCWNCGAFMQA